ncbi:MAG TPA: helix-turn-helix domain-containing protein [Sedimentisphaerales bacterium]|nr:helix-turn-helix domain-containing protein [Sedimentisphaerales bacterium]
MRQRAYIQLPAEMNPGGLITVSKAAQVTGIPKTTIYGWRRQPGNGIRFYRLGHKLFLKCDELLGWINANLETA